MQFPEIPELNYSFNKDIYSKQDFKEYLLTSFKNTLCLEDTVIHNKQVFTIIAGFNENKIYYNDNLGYLFGRDSEILLGNAMTYHELVDKITEFYSKLWSFPNLSELANEIRNSTFKDRFTSKLKDIYFYCMEDAQRSSEAAKALKVIEIFLNGYSDFTVIQIYDRVNTW
jgi:hypothetical protein